MKLSLFLATLLTAWAPGWCREILPMAAPEPETSIPALTIENWNPKASVRTPAPAPEQPKSPPSPATNTARSAEPVKLSEPVPVDTPAVTKASESKPAASPAPSPRVAGIAMNEMKGTLSRIDLSEQTLRISIEGGYTAQFNYDSKTVVLSPGSPLTVKDLTRDDFLVIRYIGRDMTAREIEKPTTPAVQ